MTWWAEDQRPAQATMGTRARQRWDQLSRDAREVVKVGEDHLAVRWPMSGWQHWRRMDREWCEQVQDATDRAHAVQLATAAAGR